MLPDDEIRLRHMVDPAREADAFLAGRKRADLDGDRMLVLALVKEVEIIGQAAAKISDQCRSAYPQIPWPDIVGMRNRLVHAYFDINLNIVWTTATEELPTLRMQVEQILGADAGPT